jgi:uncharacterized protein
MRVVSLLACTFVLIASAFGQQTAIPDNSSQPASSVQTPAAAADQRPEHPVTPAQVREILQLTGAHELAHQVMTRMMASIEKSLPPFMPKDVIDELEASLDKIDLDAMAIESYQKHVSTEDAAQLIAFYKSPAGRRVVRVLPLITQEMQEEGARQGMKISQDVIQRHIDEIRAAAMKYQQDHAAPPTITAPN